MTPRQLENYLDVIFKSKCKHSTFICSEHGIGKSSIVKQIAAKNGYKVIDFRLAQVESLDVAGMYYPTESNGVTALTNLSLIHI